MDLAIQHLNHIGEHLNRHFVGFISCINLLDIPLASGKTSMQIFTLSCIYTLDNFLKDKHAQFYVDRILISHVSPASLFLETDIYSFSLW